jgi:Uma2 family endonuclease
MVIASVKTISFKEFLEIPETKPAGEYIQNQIVQKPMPKGRHSRLQGRLCQEINLKVEASKIAYAFPELRCNFGDRSIVTDIAVFLWKNIPFLVDDEIPDNFNLAPDWIIEILSPDQNANKVIGKILHSLQHGSKLGWFLDPSDRSILTFQPNQQPVLMSNSDRLPVLENIRLELTVQTIFSWLKMGN